MESVPNSDSSSSLATENMRPIKECPQMIECKDGWVADPEGHWHFVPTHLLADLWLIPKIPK